MRNRVHFLFSPDGKAYLLENYVNGDKSTYEIASAHNTYPNMVNRAIRYHGFSLRTRSDAQKITLKTGRGPHPTKGKKLKESTKIKIGDSVHDYYKRNPDKVKQITKLASERWEKRSEEEKNKFQEKTKESHQVTARKGSSFEKYLVEFLLENNVKVIPHAKKTINNENMHIDIFLPGELVAIEIDGPSHFFPIYGEEVLKKKIEADQRKNDLLIGEGFTVIRVMVFKKNTQRASVRDCGVEILKLIKEISETPVLNANDRFFEVEVGDREIWRKVYGDRIDTIGQ